MQTLQTRDGMKLTVEILKDLGHALSCKVLKGRKSYVGKVLLINKNQIV